MAMRCAGRIGKTAPDCEEEEPKSTPNDGVCQAHGFNRGCVASANPTFTSSIPADQLQDHVVFNPPSSAPSSYHTPVAFLPPNDPRRTLLTQSHERANPYSNSDKRLPPPVRQPYEKKYHLKEEDIAEIRRLRREDPSTWTRIKLAKKFECSQFFIALVCEASQERKAQHREALEAVKSKWGKKRRYAREDRQKRRELWGRDA
ncbi:MAG: hypothetical protein Q9167_002218 [Letrouitia subvulpina]